MVHYGGAKVVNRDKSGHLGHVFRAIRPNLKKAETRTGKKATDQQCKKIQNREHT